MQTRLTPIPCILNGGPHGLVFINHLIDGESTHSLVECRSLPALEIHGKSPNVTLVYAGDSVSDLPQLLNGSVRHVPVFLSDRAEFNVRNESRQ